MNVTVRIQPRVRPQSQRDLDHLNEALWRARVWLREKGIVRNDVPRKQHVSNPPF